MVQSLSKFLLEMTELRKTVLGSRADNDEFSSSEAGYDMGTGPRRNLFVSAEGHGIREVSCVLSEGGLFSLAIKAREKLAVRRPASRNRQLSTLVLLKLA